MMRAQRTSWMAASVGLAGLAGAASGQTYHAVDLGAPGVIGDVESFQVARSGRVSVGFSTSVDRHHSAFSSKGGRFTVIPPLGADMESVAFGADESGAVVGVSYTLGEPAQHAFRWMDGISIPLGDFSARGVNGAGDVCGSMSVVGLGSLLNQHACLMTNDAGAPTDLGALGNASSSYAYAINGLRQVVGQSNVSNDLGTRAVLWWNGVIFDLGTLGGNASGAYGINEAGTIAVGWSALAGTTPVNHATRFLLNADGSVQSRVDMGTLAPGATGGGTWSYAYGVNTAGWVVGESSGRAFVDLGTGMLDLSTLVTTSQGWTIVSARTIDEEGRIAAWGIDGTARPKPVLLVPCHADVDRNGAVTVQDIFEFLNLWFAQDPRGDFNRVGGLGVQDVFDFLSAWFSGCAA